MGSWFLLNVTPGPSRPLDTRRSRPGRRPRRPCPLAPFVSAGQRYPLVLPNIRDPRLHVAAVIITIHVLGQIGPRFRVSVPQILAAILTCAVIEVALTFRQQPVVRVAGQRDAHRQRRRADPAGGRHAAPATPGAPHGWYVFAVVAGALAADEVRHQVPRLTRVQPVERRARRRVPRARQHAGRAARLLVGAARRLDDRAPTPSSSSAAADHAAAAPAGRWRRRSGSRWRPASGCWPPRATA